MKLLLPLYLILLLVSCNSEQEKKKSLGYDEFYFDEVLSSLSQDQSGDLWIGCEAGDVFWMQDNNIKKKFELGTDRIYTVMPIALSMQDTSLLVGVSNGGMQLWQFNKTSTPSIYQYTIPQKVVDYSSYDFLKAGDTIYAATSNGLYRTLLNDSEPMELIFPTPEKLYNDNFKGDYTIHNIVRQKDGSILASTPEGVLSYHPNRTKKDSLLMRIKNVEHISIYRDTIFALANNTIYCYKNGESTSLPCSNVPLVYSEDNNGNKWLISSQSIRIGRNRLSSNFNEISLLRTIPLKNGRKIFVNGKQTNFSYLISQNALWRIPIHLNIYDNSKVVKAASQDFDGSQYFITAQNELYKKEKEQPATFIKKINIDGQIQWLEVKDNQMYFHTGGKIIYQTDINHSLFSSDSPKPLFVPEVHSENITAACIHIHEHKATGIFFGTKSGLYYVDAAGKKQQIHLDESNRKYYVKSINHGDNPKNCDYLLVATLNHGLFGALGIKHLKFRDMPSGKSVIDAIPLDQDSYVVLTNQQIKIKIGDRRDSIRIKGCSKLIYMDDSTFYATGNRGINRYRIGRNSFYRDTILLNDIAFEPNACLKIAEQTLLLGAYSGSCILHDRQPATQTQYIDFTKNITSYQWIFFIIIALLIATLGVIYLRNKRMLRKTFNDAFNKGQVREKEKHMKEYRCRMEYRLQELLKAANEVINKFTDLGEAGNKNVNELKQLVEQCDNKHRMLTNKEMFDQIQESLNKHLAIANRQLGIAYQAKLEEQIKALREIGITASHQLAEKSQRLLCTQDVDKISHQISNNIIGIRKYEEQMSSLAQIQERWKNCYEIEDINQGLLHKIEIFIDKLHEETIADSDAEYAEIIKEVNNIEARNADIHSYIQQVKQGVRNQALKNNLEKCQAYENSIEMLTVLKSLMEEVSIDNKLHEIKTLTDTYYAEHQYIKQQAKDRIGTYSDSVDPLKKIRDGIARNIKEFYLLVPKEVMDFIANDLRIKNTTSNQASILALWISDKSIRGAYMHELLGKVESLGSRATDLKNALMENSKKIEVSKETHLLFDLMYQIIKDLPRKDL